MFGVKIERGGRRVALRGLATPPRKKHQIEKKERSNASALSMTEGKASHAAEV